MSDTTVVSATAAASAGVPWLLLAGCAIGVAALCYVAGWLSYHVDRRWPAANRYKQEHEQ